MILNNWQRLALVLSLLVAAAAGCSSGHDTSDSANDNSGGTSADHAGSGPAAAAKLDLIASSTTLPSSAVQSDNGVVLTAIVRDDHNNAVADPNVDFSADAGRLEVGDSASANGIATATLYNDPDRANRTIKVTATSGGVSDAMTIRATGTQITLTGPGSIAVGQRANFTTAVQDAADKGIPNTPLDIESANGNPIGAATVDTDGSGQATFAVTGQNTGMDKITVRALQADAIAPLTVGGKRLTFAAVKDKDKPPRAGSSVPLTVHYSDDNGAIGNAAVKFSASRGRLSKQTVTTNARGNAATTLASNAAGDAIVTASVGGTRASRDVAFVAGAPSTLVLKASSTTIRPAQTSGLTASVRDQYSNPVANRAVDFNLVSGTGGHLSAGQATTANDGRAQVVYTAGTSSAGEPAQITAVVGRDGSVTDKTKITVAGQALSIRLGTGGSPILSGDGTTYAAPYAALVTDAAGNPVSDGALRLNVKSVSYQAMDNPKCRTEDIKPHDGILNSGKDKNGNGQLDPGHVASVPRSPKLDTTGVAHFNLTYLARYARRVQVEVAATAEVEGSEGNQSLTFLLPGSPSSDNPFVHTACSR